MSGVTLSSHAAFCDALQRARSIAMSAYFLSAGSDVCRELERAADRGAGVSVFLDGEPDHAPAGEGASASDRALRNARVATELRGHGVCVTTVDDGTSLHIKAALVDGAAYLDDRNWPATGHDTVLRTDAPGDVAIVAGVLGGPPPTADPNFVTDKTAALALEAGMIRSACGDRIDVETESFGASVVSAALRERVAGGAGVRLIVARREYEAASHGSERALLAELATAGVRVRVSGDAEKLCATAACAWAGSANATYAVVPTLDWGLTTRDPALVAGVEQTFERNWATARPIGAAPTVAPAAGNRNENR